MWKRWWGGRHDAGPGSDPVERADSSVPTGEEAPLWQPEDEELLDRISGVIVRWGMTTPAIFLLESAKPLNFVGSQFLHFLSPIVHSVLNAKDLDRLAVLLERRETVEELIRRIEKAEAAS